MVKAYIVSGVRYGKQRAWAFRSERLAEDFYNKEKFKRGYRDLGISESINYAEAVKQCKFSHGSTPA